MDISYLVDDLSSKCIMDEGELMKLSMDLIDIFQKYNITKYSFCTNHEKYNNIIEIFSDLTIYSDQGEIYINNFEGYEMYSINYPQLTRHHYFFE